MTRIGALTDSLATAITMAQELATRMMVTLVLDDGPLPDRDAVVLRASPGAALRLQQAGCGRFVMAVAPDNLANAIPLMDQVMGALGISFAPVCLALPADGLTVYQGHLFRGPAMLNGSEPSVVRMLSQNSDGSAGLVPYGLVAQGVVSLRRALAGLREQGRRFAVVDAVNVDALVTLVSAAAGLPMLIGTTALVAALSADVSQAAPPVPAPPMPAPPMPAPPMPAPPMPAISLTDLNGPAVILSGSTTRQASFQAGIARDALAHMTLPTGSDGRDAVAWALAHLGPSPVLISCPPGQEPADVLAQIASALVQAGVRRLMLTGDATTEAVLMQLAVSRLTPDPAQPWWVAERSGPALMLALPAGQGGPNAILDAFEG